MSKVNQEKIVNHLKNYGFIFQNSEIYNGLANSWDFGPLGALLKNNLKNLWISFFVYSQKNMHLVDTNIILNPLVWKASGHIDNFSDPLIDCKNCKSRFRADKIINLNSNININENYQLNEIDEIISKLKIKCTNCKNFNWTPTRKFNLMFETSIGTIDDLKNKAYLRPETAQGIFINFKNIFRTQRLKLDFGVAQIGKSFRNEITPSNFIFRLKEFEQMEIEHFVNEKNKDKIFEFYELKIYDFLTKELNIKKENIKKINYSKSELAHYSNKTIDFFYNFPHGESELWGLSDRGEFDLKQHQKFSNKSLEYADEQNNKYLPHIIEPSVGVERLIYAILLDYYFEQDLGENDIRVVLKMPFSLSPYKLAILPLSNKLLNKADEIYSCLLKQNYSITFDSSGSIGKRYRRQDAIGTPFCLTVDFETLNDNCVTIRERDSMKQKRISLNDLAIFSLPNLFNEHE